MVPDPDMNNLVTNENPLSKSHSHFWPLANKNTFSKKNLQNKILRYYSDMMTPVTWMIDHFHDLFPYSVWRWRRPHNVPKRKGDFQNKGETHLQRQRSSDTDDDLLFIVIHCHKKRRLVNLSEVWSGENKKQRWERRCGWERNRTIPRSMKLHHFI